MVLGPLDVLPLSVMTDTETEIEIEIQGMAEIITGIPWGQHEDMTIEIEIIVTESTHGIDRTNSIYKCT